MLTTSSEPLRHEYYDRQLNRCLFSFANDDGSSRQEVGNPASSAMTVSGSYSFFTPEGELVEMQYTADENGVTINFNVMFW